MSDEVEVRQAFEWTCPECGTDHFGRLIVPEMSDDDREDVLELLEQMGLDGMEGVTATPCWLPEKVTCPDCNLKFRTISQDMAYGPEDDES